MLNEPDDDCEGEEDVERDRDRKVRKTEIVGEGWNLVDQPQGLVDEYHDTHCYVDGINSDHREGLCGSQMRTKRGEARKAGDDDNPEVLGVDNVATIDLEGAVLDD